MMCALCYVQLLNFPRDLTENFEFTAGTLLDDEKLKRHCKPQFYPIMAEKKKVGSVMVGIVGCLARDGIKYNFTDLEKVKQQKKVLTDYIPPFFMEKN